MQPTCDDWLAVIRPCLREPLFHPLGTERLRRLARRLPGDSLGVLETRLAAVTTAAPVDLSLRLAGPEQSRRLAAHLPSPHPRRLLASWGDPQSPLASVESMWLEFDLDREPDGIPMPIVCAKLRPDEEPGQILDNLFPALLGAPLDPGLRRAAEGCLRRIPAPAYLLYAFGLLSRGTGLIRLEVFGLDPDGIAGYLERVAPQALSFVEGPAGLFRDMERIHLSLELGPLGPEMILPRIGIEGSFARQPHREPRWRELLDRLLARGLCRPAERDAALAWPGYDTFRTAPEAWPETAGLRDVLGRRLSHVKVVCRPDREPEAKLYLVFEALPEGAGAG